MTAGATSARKLGPAEPIPLSVVTGFLGAGKTTLLNRLLSDRGLRDTAVLVNEVGEIGLDHLFYEVLDGETVLLPGGCLCCSVRGDLVRALEDILRGQDNGKRAPFRRVVVETTGLADPASILHAMMTHPYLVQRYRLDGVVTLVDAVNGGATLDEHREAVKQAAVADRLVLSKTDLAGAGEVAALRARLAALNPAAPVLDAVKGEATAAALLEAGLYDPASKIADVKRWLAEAAVEAAEHAHHHVGEADHAHHDDRVRVFTLASEEALPAATLESFLDLLRSIHGAKLLRLKGIVRLAEEPEQPVVLHAVQHVMHPPARLPAWPDGDRRSRLVCVTWDLDPAAVRRLFAAFLGRPQVDMPDRATLLENPLATRR
ncbi:MAG TPA: GTP-binding protein [Xanthobacteraceae bacterium]|nr:GTP-binding protein [Xanthobacteraceae bacterium]